MLNELLGLADCPLCKRHEPYHLYGWWCPICGTTDEEKEIDDLKARLIAIENALTWKNNIEN